MTNLILVLALARIIAGEAPGCPVETKIGVAHVFNNRIEAGIEGGWFGDRDPTAQDLWAAIHYGDFQDPTDGALYLVGPGDASRMAAQGMYLHDMTAHFECNGTWLESYRRAH